MASIESEQALVQRTVGGDAAAWGELVGTYRDGIRFAIARTFARFGLGRDDDAIDELENEVFLQLAVDGFRKLASFSARCSLKQWLKVVASNATIDALRARRPSLSLSDDEGLAGELADPALDPEQSLARRELERIAESLLGQLCDEDRLFVELHYARGLPQEQVAELMGTSLGATYARKSRLRKRLAALARQAEAMGG